MDLYITFSVLGAALIHATWNAFVKKEADPLIAITGLMVGSTLCVLIVYPFISQPALASAPYIIASGIIHAAYMIFLSQAYRYSDFSSAYPIARGTAPIFIFAWGYFFLHDTLSSKELVAIIGIIIGILVFATRKIQMLVNDRVALGYALLTAVCVAAYSVVDGLGARLSGNVNGYMVWMEIASFPLLFLYTYKKHGNKLLSSLRVNFKYYWFGGAMALAGYWIVVWAMTQAPIVLVSALRETSIIIGALIGAYYFKEPSGARRIFAAIIVCCSVVILRWP